MEIVFASEKLKKIFNDQKRLVRRHGPTRAKLIGQRLYELQAAETLADLRFLKGRCHELKGNLAGHLSLDLDGPYRLIFEPASNPAPRKADGGLDWTQVTAVRVISVEDTHE